MIHTYLPQSAEIFGATCLLANRMTGIFRLTRFCGIYAMRCDVDNRVYIGKSRVVRNRFAHHVLHLRRKKHDNHGFQDAWNKYGEASFSSWIIGECEESELAKLEHFYLNLTKATDQAFGFNIDHVNEAGIRIMAESTKKKISEANSGRIFSLETRLKISQSSFGKTRPMSEEQKRKIGIAHKGRIFTKEHRMALVNGWKIRKAMNRAVPQPWVS